LQSRLPHQHTSFERVQNQVLEAVAAECTFSTSTVDERKFGIDYSAYFDISVASSCLDVNTYCMSKTCGRYPPMSPSNSTCSSMGRCSFQLKSSFTVFAFSSCSFAGGIPDLPYLDSELSIDVFTACSKLTTYRL
jgi:hypothetical protein